MKSAPTHPPSSDLHTFFQKFDQLVDAPNAVAKIRELILQLAIQGRLTTQPDGVGFPQVRLDSLGSWAQGCGFPIAEQGHTDRPILFSKVSDMNLLGNEREINKTNHTIDKETAKKLRIKVHPLGTVIFPKIGGAIATNKRRILVLPTAIDNNCSGIIPNKDCSTPWLFLLLSAIDFAKYQSGTSVPAVNQKALGEIVVSLPPLAEQKRIVAKVDELMAQCDRLEAQLKERETKQAVLARATLARFSESPTPENLELLFHDAFAVSPSDHRKTILTLAVQGKLLPQDPNDEPASELLKQIEAEKNRLVKAGKIKQPKPLDPIKPEEMPYELPKGWQWVSIQDISFKVTDGEHITPKRSDSGFYLLSARNITNEGIKLDDVDYVEADEFRRIRSRCNPEIGDILLSCSGSVGRVAICDTDQYVMVRSAAFIKHSHPHLHSSYLALSLKSPLVQTQILEKSKTTAQSNLFLGKILELLIPLPPLAEQHRIVAKVDQLMALVDALENQITSATHKQTTLLNALLAQA